ncbi:MAG: type 1 glutamine amidotransferase [Betaproteobacteria bacterium]|nr:type 1 glutamine amidotransferase [Betaproteobacteria bacterium]
MKPIAILRFSADDGPGYCASVLDRQSVPWALFALDEGASPPASLDAFSGLVLMGGPMSANDPLPWIPPVLDLIRAARSRGVPVLGHCLGGQLMSKALGGEVTLNPVKEIGWQPVIAEDHATARDWLGDWAGRAFRVFQWHGDTFSIPPGATRILAGDACANQAFVVGNSLAMQCHVEMTPDMVHQWCGDWEAEGVAPSASVESAAQIAGGIEAHLQPMRGVADRLYLRWLQGVKEALRRDESCPGAVTR